MSQAEPLHVRMNPRRGAGERGTQRWIVSYIALSLLVDLTAAAAQLASTGTLCGPCDASGRCDLLDKGLTFEESYEAGDLPIGTTLHKGTVLACIASTSGVRVCVPNWLPAKEEFCANYARSSESRTRNNVPAFNPDGGLYLEQSDAHLGVSVSYLDQIMQSGIQRPAGFGLDPFLGNSTLQTKQSSNPCPPWRPCAVQGMQAASLAANPVEDAEDIVGHWSATHPEISPKEVTKRQLWERYFEEVEAKERKLFEYEVGKGIDAIAAPGPDPGPVDITLRRKGSISESAAVTAMAMSANTLDPLAEPPAEPPSLEPVAEEASSPPETLWLQRLRKPADSANGKLTPGPADFTKCGFSAFGVCWSRSSSKRGILHSMFGRRINEGASAGLTSEPPGQGPVVEDEVLSATALSAPGRQAAAHYTASPAHAPAQAQHAAASPAQAPSPRSVSTQPTRMGARPFEQEAVANNQDSSPAQAPPAIGWSDQPNNRVLYKVVQDPDFISSLSRPRSVHPPKATTIASANGVQFVVDQPLTVQENGHDINGDTRYISHTSLDWAEPRYGRLSVSQPVQHRGDLLAIMGRRDNFLSSILRDKVGF